MKYRALSVYQPWPQLILQGSKTVEIRSRPINYRGPLLICSSKKEWPHPLYPNLPKGVAICLVDIVDCRLMVPEDSRTAFYPFKEGMWAWCLAFPRLVPNIPIKGRQGIFFVEADF